MEFLESKIRQSIIIFAQSSGVKTEASVEAVVLRCSVKKVLLEISKNLQENTYTRVFFLIKLTITALSTRQRGKYHTKHAVNQIKVWFICYISNKLSLSFPFSLI